ncbi:MAG: hypothetical protein M3R52_03245 [Acidobacteriota bacterium]|nr:hypothetical protein [Acidobacteriota bacterium]
MSGNQIELERPLPYDVRAEWAPEIHRFVPSVQEVGVEHLSIHFPWTAYPGHFKEKGYNALFFQDVSQCWINDLEIQNSDFANSSLFSQLDLGAGTRPFNSGGSSNRGAHAGAYNTYWNIRATGPLQPPPADFGPLLNFIGLVTNVTNGKTVDSPYQWIVEQIEPTSLCPMDLHEAMRTRRLGRR